MANTRLKISSSRRQMLNLAVSIDSHVLLLEMK